eukprot:Nk52_evm15s210 gene=Nk52_evmTU15s210
MNTGDDCYYFYHSSCSKGEMCGFRHVEGAKGATTTCESWRQGACTVPDCDKLHSEAPKQRGEIACYWETQPSGCQKPNCPFKHVKPRDNMTGSDGANSQQLQQLAQNGANGAVSPSTMNPGGAAFVGNSTSNGEPFPPWGGGGYHGRGGMVMGGRTGGRGGGFVARSGARGGGSGQQIMMGRGLEGQQQQHNSARMGGGLGSGPRGGRGYFMGGNFQGQGRGRGRGNDYQQIQQGAQGLQNETVSSGPLTAPPPSAPLSKAEVEEKQRLLKEKLNKLKSSKAAKQMLVEKPEQDIVPDVEIKSFDEIMKQKKEKKPLVGGLKGNSKRPDAKSRLSPIINTSKGKDSDTENDDVKVKSFEEIMREKKKKVNAEAASAPKKQPVESKLIPKTAATKPSTLQKPKRMVAKAQSTKVTTATKAAPPIAKKSNIIPPPLVPKVKSGVSQLKRPMKKTASDVADEGNGPRENEAKRAKLSSQFSMSGEEKEMLMSSKKNAEIIGDDDFDAQMDLISPATSSPALQQQEQNAPMKPAESLESELSSMNGNTSVADVTASEKTDETETATPVRNAFMDELDDFDFDEDL